MRFMSLVLCCLTLFVMGGCQSKGGGAFQASSPVSVISKPGDIEKINGDWLTLFHSVGIDYSLEAKITTEFGRIRFALSGQGKEMEMPTTGRRKGAIAPVPSILSGALDNDTYSFTVHDHKGNRMRLYGVFESPERFVAIVQGRSWPYASMLIGVRGKQREALEEMMAEADSKLAKVLSNSSIGVLVRSFAFRVQGNNCSGDETDWAESIRKAVADSQNKGSKTDALAMSVAMFGKEYYGSAFGDSLYELGKEEGEGIATRLEATRWCGHLDTRNRFEQQVLNNIKMFLRNTPPLTRDYAMINNAAAEIIRSWMTATGARLEVIKRTYEEEPGTGLAKVGALTSAVERMDQHIWPSSIGQYRGQLVAAADFLKKKKFFKGLDQLLATNISSLEEMNRLALYPSKHAASYKLMSAQEKTEITKRIQTRLDSGTPNIVSAAKEFADRQKSVSDLTDNLAPVRSGRFSAMAKYTSPQHLAEVQAIFQSRKTSIINGIVRANSLQMTRIMSENGSPERQLRGLVGLRKSFAASNRRILNEPAISQSVSAMRRQSMGLLESMEAGILGRIRSARSLGDIGDPLKGLILEEDEKSRVVKRVNYARQTKMAEFMKFKPVRNAADLNIGSFTSEGLDYESELMAIYLGDFSHARIEPGGLAINKLFLDYLYAFSRHCRAYLPANRVPITKNVCAEYEVKTLNGLEQSRTCIREVAVPTGEYADPRLYRASKRLGAVSTLNTLPKFLNILGGRSGGRQSLIPDMGILDEARSGEGDMDKLVRLNRCDNAGLKRFENNMYNFVKGIRPLQLPGKVDMAMIRNIRSVSLKVDAVDLRSLLDTLIRENSRNWVVNRYMDGSIGNIRVNSKDRDGSPSSVSASYMFSSFGKRHNGQVTLQFEDKLPSCLYFSDAPQACRHPSRRVVTDYEKGRYKKR